MTRTRKNIGHITRQRAYFISRYTYFIILFRAFLERAIITISNPEERSGDKNLQYTKYVGTVKRFRPAGRPAAVNTIARNELQAEATRCDVRLETPFALGIS